MSSRQSASVAASAEGCSARTCSGRGVSITCTGVPESKFNYLLYTVYAALCNFCCVCCHHCVAGSPGTALVLMCCCCTSSSQAFLDRLRGAARLTDSHHLLVMIE